MSDDPLSGTVWPAPDPESEQIREVFARYGLAMFTAHCLEHSVVNANLILNLLPTRSRFSNAREWELACDSFYHHELAKTFGNMIKALQNCSDISIEILNRLKSAKESRDELAHRFFWKNDAAFLNENGRMYMIARCERFIADFSCLSNDIDAAVSDKRKQFGISDACLESVFVKSLDEAKQWAWP